LTLKVENPDKTISYVKAGGQDHEMLLDLASKILRFDPEKRINIKQILEHPFFKMYHNPKLEVVQRKTITVTRDYKVMPPLRQEMYELINNIHSEYRLTRKVNTYYEKYTNYN
jgi:serine/threonine protein kinase